MRPERSRKAETLMVLLAHPCPKMSLILSKIKQKQPVHYAQTQFSVLHHQQSAPSSSSGNKISPAILFTIIILAVVFFISGLLHLLVRFLVKRSRPSSTSEADRNAEFAGSDDAFQRQLQQLFNLHDSGLDQAFIDALPVFLYREIAMGVKEPFDCAVCLSEFSEQDKLRLLPLCSHAFHIDCIDRWLLSNSSCPLCRGSLNAHGMAFENPAFDLEDPREEEEKEEDRFSWIGEHGASISQKPEENSILSSKRVFSVRLGKLRRFNDGRVEIGDGESSSINTGTSTSNPSLDSRRCFSMGSYQYVVSDLELQVTLCPDGSRNHQKGSIGNANEGNLNFHGDCEGKRISIGSKAESFSVSKIWLWSKKTRAPDCPEAHIGSVPLPLSLPWMDKSQVT